jgi:uncharacterized Fe-S cluster-containing protein
VSTLSVEALPGLDCGACGYRTCDALAERVAVEPEILKRCIYLSEDKIVKPETPAAATMTLGSAVAERATPLVQVGATGPVSEPWKDSLGRDFDFYLDHFPNEPGPREIILPHNPALTRELNIQPGDVLIGRPLGMSCGCPITHCGVVMQSDPRNGVIVWCVTGPLRPRAEGYKDLGYYIAEGYEGLVHRSRAQLRIGARYFFQPTMCMLQWRHSGLVNYINHASDGVQVRLEGLWIG